MSTGPEDQPKLQENSSKCESEVSRPQVSSSREQQPDCCCDSACSRPSTTDSTSAANKATDAEFKAADPGLAKTIAKFKAAELALTAEIKKAADNSAADPVRAFCMAKVAEAMPHAFGQPIIYSSGAADSSTASGSSRAAAAASTAASTPDAVAATSKQSSVPIDRQLQNLMKSLKPNQNPLEAKHPFWDTQPTLKAREEVPEGCKIGPIDESFTVEAVRKEPYILPAPFRWVSLNVHDATELQEMYSLLADNYVEDDDSMFRFNYSKEFLHWALTPPDYFVEWHIGVRTDKGKLVACITGIPAEIHVCGNNIKLAEINFLCVHKKLRAKRLAPVLIKEVTRRVFLRGMFRAVYTAGVLLTKPVAQCTYFHRSLNIRKLIDVKFTGLTGKMTMSMAQKLYKLPEAPLTPGLRPMEKKDVPTALELLLKDFAEHASLYPVFSLKEAEHVLLPRKNIIVSYVREQDGKVTDFLSFYVLPSSVIGHEKHTSLKAGYCYYYVATSVPVVVLMKDALIIAKSHEMDVFNALDLGRNQSFIKELKFGKGDGSLRYYLYNYLCPSMEPEKIGLVML